MNHSNSSWCFHDNQTCVSSDGDAWRSAGDGRLPGEVRQQHQDVDRAESAELEGAPAEQTVPRTALQPVCTRRVPIG